MAPVRQLVRKPPLAQMASAMRMPTEGTHSIKREAPMGQSCGIDLGTHEQAHVAVMEAGKPR